MGPESTGVSGQWDDITPNAFKEAPGLGLEQRLSPMVFRFGVDVTCGQRSRIHVSDFFFLRPENDRHSRVLEQMPHKQGRATGEKPCQALLKYQGRNRSAGE